MLPVANNTRATFGRAATVVLAISLSIGSMSVSKAQEFLPLNSIDDEADKPYPFVRCAGLYYAVIAWSGKTRLGPETYQGYRISVDLLGNAALLIRRAEGSDVSTEDLGKSTLNEVVELGKIYVARMESNLSSTGQPMSDDPLFDSDFETCQLYARAAQELASKVASP